MSRNVTKLMGGHSPERRVPRAKHVPAGRGLHLDDIENLMGGPRADLPAIYQVRSCYLDTVPIGENDHFVIGANPQIAPFARVFWPSAELVAMRGPNGADIALIERVKDVPFVASLYDRIVIGSGDGVFVHVARAYRYYGLKVEVVSRRRSLSRELMAVASTVYFLPLPEADFDLAA